MMLVKEVNRSDETISLLHLDEQDDEVENRERVAVASPIYSSSFFQRLSCFFSFLIVLLLAAIVFVPTGGSMCYSFDAGKEPSMTQIFEQLNQIAVHLEGRKREKDDFKHDIIETMNAHLEKMENEVNDVVTEQAGFKLDATDEATNAHLDKMKNEVNKIQNDRDCIKNYVQASVRKEFVYFKEGADMAPGNYVIKYEDGCMKTNKNQPWQVHLHHPSNLSYYHLIGEKSTFESGWLGVLPGIVDGFDNFDYCVAANKAKSHPIVYSHTGGKLGVFVYDTYYDDNVEGSPSPTYSIVPLACTV